MLNQFFWVYVLYVLTPRELKKPVKLNFPFVPNKKEQEGTEIDFGDLTELDTVPFSEIKKSFEEKIKNRGK